VCSALQLLLKHEPGVRVVGEVGDAENLLIWILSAHPDLILVDWGLPGLAAVGSLPALREDNPTLKVIVMSGRPEERQQALTAGADVFVSKIDPPEQLLTALHAMNSEKTGMETQTA
jgi:two-component system nitrate/nitrite response regulator NarL